MEESKHCAEHLTLFAPPSFALLQSGAGLFIPPSFTLRREQPGTNLHFYITTPINQHISHSQTNLSKACNINKVLR